jgi:3,4-dihydroxy 2-butanone 4-phosphate synthase/GTP cyclohydrolase II
VALVHGRIGDGKDMPVRLHRADSIADIFEGGKAINAAMKRFAKEGRGILVYLRDGTAGVPTTNLNEHEETASEAMRSSQWREIGLGAQILRDLGVASIRNLATSSRSYVGLSGFGIELLAEEPLDL